MATWFQRGIRAIAHTALDFFFPPRCFICDRIAFYLCNDCSVAIPYPEPIFNAEAALSLQCVTAVHEGAIRDAIHALKYEGRLTASVSLVARMAQVYHNADWCADLIVPLPMHPSRIAKRGYNQADVLGKALAHLLNIPYQANAAQRTRDTIPQVGLSAHERRDNVADAFCADSNLVQGRYVVLVDDVYTTGATLNACAEALLIAGAVQVFGLTVSYAPKHPIDTK